MMPSHMGPFLAHSLVLLVARDCCLFGVLDACARRHNRTHWQAALCHRSAPRARVWLRCIALSCRPVFVPLCDTSDLLRPSRLFFFPPPIHPHSRPRFAFTTNKPSLTPIHSFIYLFAISFISYTDIHDYSRCIDDFFFFFFFWPNMISA